MLITTVLDDVRDSPRATVKCRLGYNGNLMIESEERGRQCKYTDWLPSCAGHVSASSSYHVSALGYGNLVEARQVASC